LFLKFQRIYNGKEVSKMSGDRGSFEEMQLIYLMSELFLVPLLKETLMIMNIALN
jgi:hypothetical protein